jgi:hypothetical protein
MRLAMRVLVALTLPVVTFAWVIRLAVAPIPPECGELQLLDRFRPDVGCVPSAIEIAAVGLIVLAIAAVGYAVFRPPDRGATPSRRST